MDHLHSEITTQSTDPQQAISNTRSSSQQHRPLAEKMAASLHRGYACHDAGDRSGAIDAFAFLDKHQFDHVADSTAHQAATTLVDALWAKDTIESEHVAGGQVTDPEGLIREDWQHVEDRLQERATLVDIDSRYARAMTIGWKRHKIGGDYTTPILQAKSAELQAALGAADYPEKRRAGQSGFGELPARYLVAVELHDSERGEGGSAVCEVMTPYYEFVLESREG